MFGCCYQNENLIKEFKRLEEVMENYRLQKQDYMKYAATRWRDSLISQHGVGCAFNCNTVTTLAHAIQLTIGYGYEGRYSGKDKYDDAACAYALEALRSYVRPFGFRVLIGRRAGTLTTITIKKGTLTLLVTSDCAELSPPREEVEKASKQWEKEFDGLLDEQTKRDIYNYKNWMVFPIGPKK